MTTALPSIRTARLILRPFRSDDAALFAELNADPRVTEFLPAPLTRAESDAVLHRIMTDATHHDLGPWAVEVPGTLSCGGFVGLWRPTFMAHFTPTVEIGWRLHPSLWGQGIATEAAQAALRFGFAEVGLPLIHSFTVPANRRSLAVMHKVGLRPAEPPAFDHLRLPEGHPLRRHLLYQMTKEAWQTNHAT